MQHLRAPEDQSVYVLHEAYKHLDDLAMRWYYGKRLHGLNDMSH